MVRRVLLVLALVGCRRADAPRDSAVAAPADAAALAAPADAVRDVARDASIDARGRACGDDPARELALSRGKLVLVAPDGMCLRRLMEGDDQSGVVIDDAGRVWAHYYALSFDVVGDACDAKRPERKTARDAKERGIAYRACELTDGRHCVSLHGAANVCTEAGPDQLDLQRMISLLRRR